VKSLIKLIAVLVAMTALVFLGGCEKQTPFESDSSKQTLDPQQDQIRFISFGGNSSFEKTTTVSKWIARKSGGNLYLTHQGDSGLVCAVILQILPGTISEDAQVSISIDDEQFIGNLDVEFKPHGITFSQPAILNIKAYGLDLSGFDPNSIDIYYDNPDTGQWELMPRDDIYVNVSLGLVRVTNARIPHFSRYAIGAE